MIVPVGIGFKNKWKLNTWDQFIIPKPFNEITIIWGTPIKEGKKNNQWVWDSDDCRIRVKARSKLYDFQIKRNVTSSSRLSYDNLKFEPTEQGKGCARMGKAATFLVEELLHNEGVPFKNDKNDPMYPKTYELFDERHEQEYKNKLQNIKRAGVDIGVSVEDAIKNLKLVMSSCFC